MEKYIQIYMTIDSKEKAEDIAQDLLVKKLVACVQVSQKVQSYYRWKGKVESSTEYLCLMKSKATLFEQLRDAIIEKHPYDVPEIIAVPIVELNPAYAHWIDESCIDATS